MVTSLLSLLLSLCLLGSSSAFPWKAVGNPVVNTESEQSDGAQILSRAVRFDDGDIYEARKIVFTKTEETDYSWEIRLPGTAGSLRCHSPETGWQTLPLAGTLPIALLHISTDQGHMLLSPAYMYKRFGTSLEDQAELVRPASVTHDGGEFTIRISFPQNAGLEGHVWYLASTSALVQWTEGQEAMWSTYGRVADQRWAYDGYYFKTPDSYRPYSSSMYWRNPGAYLPRAVTLSGQSRASDRLSWIMLDTMLDYQHEDGYWPSDPESAWLKGDYGIGGGFYDTRFNADTTETYLTGFRKTHDLRFLEAALRQLAFYERYAEKNHYTLTDGERAGWLVYDYDWPGHEAKPTLCALNHQLQEIQTLLEAYDITRSASYLHLSELLTEGLRLVGDRWIRPDGSLEYAYMPDGTMGKTDYEYLSYNNLFDLQNLRARIGLGRDPFLQKLMDSKKAQMDRDGITDYKK